MASFGRDPERQAPGAGCSAGCTLVAEGHAQRASRGVWLWSRGTNTSPVKVAFGT